MSNFRNENLKMGVLKIGFLKFQFLGPAVCSIYFKRNWKSVTFRFERSFKWKWKFRNWRRKRKWSYFGSKWAHRKWWNSKYGNRKWSKYGDRQRCENGHEFHYFSKQKQIFGKISAKKLAKFGFMSYTYPTVEQFWKFQEIFTNFLLYSKFFYMFKKYGRFSKSWKCQFFKPYKF